MFLISQYLLNATGTCKNVNQVSTYSVAVGLVLYASIYLYMLFYNEEYLVIFNKFIIYIIIIDLVLSAFYYFNIQSSYSEDDACMEPTKYKIQPISDYQIVKDNEDLDSDDDDSLELESDDESEEEVPEQEIQEQEIQEVDEKVGQDAAMETILEESEVELESTPFVITPADIDEMVQESVVKPKRVRATKKKTVET